jgi:hypothetical protein
MPGNLYFPGIDSKVSRSNYPLKRTERSTLLKALL